MAGSKVKSTRGGFGIKGGSGHMSGQNTVGTQKPGQTASQGQKSGGNKFAAQAGGSGKMHGATGVGAQQPGQTATSTGGMSSNFGVQGGTTKMFGPQQSNPAKPR